MQSSTPIMKTNALTVLSAMIEREVPVFVSQLPQIVQLVMQHFEDPPVIGMKIMDFLLICRLG